MVPLSLHGSLFYLLLYFGVRGPVGVFSCNRAPPMVEEARSSWHHNHRLMHQKRMMLLRAQRAGGVRREEGMQWWNWRCLVWRKFTCIPARYLSFDLFFFLAMFFCSSGKCVFYGVRRDEMINPYNRTPRTKKTAFQRWRIGDYQVAEAWRRQGRGLQIGGGEGNKEAVSKITKRPISVFILLFLPQPVWPLFIT